MTVEEVEYDLAGWGEFPDDPHRVIELLFSSEIFASPRRAENHRIAVFREYAQRVNNRYILSLSARDAYEIAEANHHCGGNFMEHVEARKRGELTE